MEIRVTRYKHPEQIGFEGTIEPRPEHSEEIMDQVHRGEISAVTVPRWIIFWRPDGSGQLYANRDDKGGVIGDPIELPPCTVQGVDNRAKSPPPGERIFEVSALDLTK